MATSPVTSPLRLSQSSPHDDAPPATMPTPPRTQDLAGMELEQLESLLDSVVAAMVIIQSHSTLLVIYSPHCQEAFTIIMKMLMPGSPHAMAATLPNPLYALSNNGGKTTKSYAEVTTQNTAMAPAAHVRKLSLAGHHAKISQSLKPVFSYNAQDKEDADLQKLEGASVTKTCWLRTGDTSKQQQPAYWTFHLLQLYTRPLILTYPGMGLAPQWGEEEVREALRKGTGLLDKDIQQLQVLCHESEIEEKQTVSLRIMLEDPHLGDNLCRHGAYLFGMRCRASQYRPRRKQHIPCPRPTTA
ncbi:hypothetical protein CPB84DRAFT_1749499 [Gymnopilus junonius]|uniref:Uncharacterized protein n=1 Tax=Gymnopilus junonius TaxID=109634 RepID=A0A9P5NFU3_GYMJU|nr:hypothetical protein CPB84DRAFT_1749499 [Gymnopilus junonius]